MYRGYSKWTHTAPGTSYRGTSAIRTLRLEGRSVGVVFIQENREQNQEVSVFLNVVHVVMLIHARPSAGLIRGNPRGVVCSLTQEARPQSITIRG